MKHLFKDNIIIYNIKIQILIMYQVYINRRIKKPRLDLLTFRKKNSQEQKGCENGERVLPRSAGHI